jgi:hypothetical protein
VQKRIRLRTSCLLVSRCKAVACCWLALLMLLTVEGPRWLMIRPFERPPYNIHIVLANINCAPCLLRVRRPTAACGSRRA